MYLARAQSRQIRSLNASFLLCWKRCRPISGDGANSFGPSIAVEITPVKNWLELEFGAPTEA
jgi:hypothetical protein